MGDRVTLNVGGRKFETSMSTITKDPHSLLAKIAVHDFQKVSGGRSAFIDRDSTHFRHILNYLRDGDCVLPGSQESQRELRREAQFFQVQGLLDMLSATIADDSISGQVTAALWGLRCGMQEGKLINRLRQEAGPALIEKLERMLLQAAYAPGHEYGELLIRRVHLSDICIPAKDWSTCKLSQKSSFPDTVQFAKSYIEVIKFDLAKIGYAIKALDDGGCSLEYSLKHTRQATVTLQSLSSAAR